MVPKDCRASNPGLPPDQTTAFPTTSMRNRYETVETVGTYSLKQVRILTHSESLIHFVTYQTSTAEGSRQWLSPLLLEPLVNGRRKIHSVTNGGVYAAADRQGTLGNDVDDVLRAISPPPVRHLSVAPLMIVVGDLMTCVRFAFACHFRVSQVHMIQKRPLRHQKDTPGVIYELQAATWLTLQRGAPASNWAFYFKMSTTSGGDWWQGWQWQ